jgi:hypothetical protein
MAIFLSPSLRDAGPDGASVMAGLMRRRIIDVMPLVAILTVLSGLYMYWYDSGGFSSSYLGSGVGITFGAGAVAALIALGIGLGVLRPSMVRTAALSRDVESVPPEQRESTMQTIQALRLRAASAGRIVAWLLAFATVAMAVARYV